MKKLIKTITYELDLKYRLMWAVHNVAAHPLMALLPRTAGQWLHDKTAPNEIDEAA